MADIGRPFRDASRFLDFGRLGSLYRFADRLRLE
jgi:hypothetical protein